MSQVLVLAGFTAFLTICSGLPMLDGDKLESIPTNNWSLQNTTNKLRQDEGEGGGDGFNIELGQQVGQIINGVLFGNIGDIFAGTIPFIEDQDVQTGVGGILTSLAQPLNTIWSTGTMQTLKYFGITAATTANPLLQANATTISGQVVANTVPITAAPASVVAVTRRTQATQVQVSGTDDDDDTR